MRVALALVLSVFTVSGCEKGADGKDGVAGPPGATGATGATGAMGASGAMGAAGAMGATGTAGTAAPSPSPVALPTAGLIGRYRGDGVDLSPTGANAVVTSVTPAPDRFGNANKAGHYDRAMPSSLVVANTALPLGVAARAASVWVHPTGGLDGYMQIFMWGDVTTNHQRFGELLNPFSCDDFFSAEADDFAGTFSLSDGDWHHIVVNSDGHSVWIYVDGEFSAGGELQAPNNLVAQTLYVGTDSKSNEAYSGDIDDLRIYNRMLTKEERRALFEENGWQ